MACVGSCPAGKDPVRHGMMKKSDTNGIAIGRKKHAPPAPPPGTLPLHFLSTPSLGREGAGEREWAETRHVRQRETGTEYQRGEGAKGHLVHHFRRRRRNPGFSRHLVVELGYLPRNLREDRTLSVLKAKYRQWRCDSIQKRVQAPTHKTHTPYRHTNLASHAIQTHEPRRHRHTGP